uniref:Uncharacterized protein n=1 Tax=Anguilla anguilla TaxID=7936 RepID=A0A0E9WR62_ANGAN
MTKLIKKETKQPPWRKKKESLQCGGIAYSGSLAEIVGMGLENKQFIYFQL